MTRYMLTVWILLGFGTGSASAEEEGLRYLLVTFDNPSESVLEVLGTRPGMVAASWDSTRNAFRVDVEDSLQFVPRVFLQDMEARGHEVKDLTLHFETARSMMHDHTGWVASEPNRMELVARNTTINRRMWDFVARNPRGLRVEMRMDCRVFPATVPDSAGVFPPDSVDVIRFRVATKLLKDGS